MSDGRILVAEITVVVDNAGTEQTFYFSTSPFATGPSDVPANTPISAYLKSAGTLKIDLFSKGRVTGLVQPNYGIMTLANPLDSNGKGVFDDWANYGVSNGKVIVRIGYIGTSYPSAWTTVYIARVHKLSILEDVNITLRDRSQLLDKPFAADVFLGTGNEEGNGAGLGRKKQFVLGDPGWFPPICINVQKQIYFVGKTGVYKDGTTQRFSFPLLENSFDVYDNGVKITAAPDYISWDDLYNNVPNEGEVRYWFGNTSTVIGPTWYNGPIYFRLGSPPAGEVRVFGVGAPNDVDFTNLGWPHGNWNMEYLAMRAGIESIDLDVNTGYVGVGEQLVEDDRSYLQVMSDGAIRTNAWFGFTKQDKFKSGFVLDPENNAYHYGITTVPGWTPPDTSSTVTTSLFTFTDDNIIDLRSDPVSGQETPMWAGVFNAGRTWPVSNLAGGTTDIMRDNLTRDPWYTSFKAYADATKIKHPNSETIEVDIPSRTIVSEFSRNIYSARFMWLYAGTPRTYTFKTEMIDEVLALELNDVVKLQTARFGLDAGVKMRVIGITINTNTRDIELVLWVNGRGLWTGATSPLDPGTDAYDKDRKTRKKIDKIGKVYIPDWSILSTGGTTISSGGDSRVNIPNWKLISSGTLGTFDSHLSNVWLLLHCEGTTNNFIDSSLNDRDIRNADVGNITQSTSQFYAGTKSMSADGSGDYLSIALTDSFNGDFFFEFAARITSASDDICFLQVGNYVVHRMLSDSKIKFYDGVADRITQSGTMATGVWKYIALGRSAGVVYLFVDNGAGTAILEGTYNTSTTLSGFMYLCNELGFRDELNGYMDEIRITRGICRHTASYPIPVVPFFDQLPYSDVTLLLNFDGTDGSTTITDESVYANNKTGASHIRVGTSQSKFGGSSLKITQIGNATEYLQFNGLYNQHYAVRTGRPWGCEFWLYYVSSPNFVTAPVLIRVTDGSNYIMLTQYGNTPKLWLDTNAAGDQTTATAYTANTWHHVRLQMKADNTMWVRLDGVSLFTGVSCPLLSGDGIIYVGNYGATSDACEVYIDNLRVWRNYEYADTDFTPPTTPHGLTMP